MWTILERNIILQKVWNHGIFIWSCNLKVVRYYSWASYINFKRYPVRFGETIPNLEDDLPIDRGTVKISLRRMMLLIAEGLAHAESQYKWTNSFNRVSFTDADFAL
jgi:hypothetical protein